VFQELSQTFSRKGGREYCIRKIKEKEKTNSLGDPVTAGEILAKKQQQIVNCHSLFLRITFNQLKLQTKEQHLTSRLHN